MTPETNIAALERAAASWNRGDLAGYLELYAPHAAVHGYAGVEPGLASLKQFYEGFWAAFPGSQLIFEDVFSSGDRLAVRFVVKGTHRGELMGVPATGKDVTLPGITILRFENGKCVERWSQTDFLGLLQQIGAM